MLGNFSFGDYFKKESILWAWEFMTKALKLKDGQLWVSVYTDDEEAYGIWKDEIGVPKRKIMQLGEKENFWPSEAPSKGPNGPCGPCSEIFYDYGEGVGCGKPDCTPDCGCGRFVEVWNLVFTQFDRQSDGSLKPLPGKNIDTGMGLERLASVMQGVRTNFEIDIFKPIVEAIESYSVQRTAYSEKKLTRYAVRSAQCEPRANVNAIADHIRAAAFAIANGVMPSNEERGYVVRKLIRRSCGYAADLGIHSPHLYTLVSVIADVMKAQYPELLEQRDDIAQVIKREEEGYRLMLDTQLPKVEEAFKKFTAEGKGRKGALAEKLAETAFNFYDTYGMPYDMLEETAEKFALKIDKGRFEGFMEKQRGLSRARSKIKGEIFSETLAKKVESLGLKTEFLGYETTHADAKVLDVFAGGEVILDRTPFYGESGGQIGDSGTIETKLGRMQVLDAKKIGETIVHIGRLLSGKIVKGETARAAIDEGKRKLVMRNHTATHLLQAALRKVLGGHVRQTGSLVDSDHLRFDFTHMKKMEPREVGRVEEMVNEVIKKAVAVKKDEMDVAAAKNSGAIALFGEKYGAVARVVSIGEASKELCGGTHVDNTRDIGIFTIISESSIASGVRRIEALTGDAAREWLRKEDEAQSSKLKAQSAKEAARKRLDERLRDETARIDEFLLRGRPCGGIKVVAEIIDGVDIEVLRTLSDRIKTKDQSAVIILATTDAGKVLFIISLAETAAKNGKLNAAELAKGLAKSLGGSGGGRPDFAQGGGKDSSRLKEALNDISRTIGEKIR
jgi:alanyl-tRNA synthetase